MLVQRALPHWNDIISNTQRSGVDRLRTILEFENHHHHLPGLQQSLSMLKASEQQAATLNLN